MLRTISVLRCLALVLWFSPAAPAWAQLQIEGKPRWGFDGLVRVNEFNLFTTELFNNSDKPWRGEIRLQAQLGLGPVDIALLQPDLLIEPYGRRHLQFLVYVPQLTDYVLSWGRRGDEFLRIDEPTRTETQAVVQLSPTDSFRTGIKGLPAFDESDFPSSAAGLTSLGTVILDHVPRWTEAQARAFRDWLATGGQLHLYEEVSGKFPVFSGLLSELNHPEDKFAVARGRVVRHTSTVASSETPVPPAQPANNRYHEWHTAQTLFALLRELTRPEHNWPIIYLMAVTYLLLLFPGCWLLGRRRGGDFRVTYAAILAIVFVFSVGFRTVGARGYGEVTSIYSAALVRPAADGRAVVTQWSNLFVTAGGNYEVSHPLEGNVYSTGQTNEAARGVALNRPYSKVILDIPSFTARSLVNTGVMNDLRRTPDSPPIEVELLQSDFSEGATPKLTVRITGLTQETTFDVGVVKGRDYFPLNSTRSGEYDLVPHAQSLDLLLTPDAWSSYANSWVSPADNPERSAKMLSNIRPALIAWDLGLTNENQRLAFSLPDGELRLYIFTELPVGLYAQGISEQQSGRMVISVPLSLD